MTTTQQLKWTPETVPQFGSERIAFESYCPSANPEDWYTITEHPPNRFSYEEEYYTQAETYRAADCSLEMKIDGRHVYSIDWTVVEDGCDEESEPTERDVYEAFIESLSEHAETEEE